MIFELALTGGPGGGKTTTLEFVCEKLKEMGFRVFIIHEVPTQFIYPGIPDIGDLAKQNHPLFLEIQHLMIKDYSHRRSVIKELALKLYESTRMKTVIIHDRAGMDFCSYMDEESFYKSLFKLGLSPYDACESLDVVIHMVTAAQGAEHSYTTQNNKARREEKIEEAIEADLRTLWAWANHPKLKIVSSTSIFKEKKEKVLQALLSVINQPNKEIERKFLLRSMPDFNHPVLKKAEVGEIKQFYTNLQGPRIRYRKRTRRGFSTYSKTRKKRISAFTREEEEVVISREEYEREFINQMAGTFLIEKRRYYFIYNYQRFELDEFIKPRKFYLLEIELSSENDTVDLPNFLNIEREVTHEPAYSNFNISKIQTI